MKKVIMSFLMLAVYAGVIKTGNLTFDFYKESYENGNMDKIGGFLYMKAGSNPEDNNFYIHITYPVNQILAFGKKETQIYYPNEKKAFIMENKDGGLSKDNFMEPATKKMDLASIGFTLVETKKSKEETKELWVSKNIVVAAIKSILLERDGQGRLLKMEMRGNNGKVSAKLEYEDYVKIGNKEIPFFIKSYAAGDKDSYQDIIKLSNVKENSKLPEIIQNFNIPADAKIQRINF